MRDDYDRSSKWLIQHHGDSILRLSGIRGVRTWRSLQADLVQPRRLPDGLLEVYFEDQTDPDLFIIEIATYPEPRVLQQVLRDSMLVFLDRGELPEVLTLVLHPRGTLRINGTAELQSRRQLSQWLARWRVVELWTLPAQELFAANDIGLIPWVPLTRFESPPEAVLEQCRQRVEQQAKAEDRANLLAVTQVLTRLRYNDPQLLTILGGIQVMIESPLIQEIVARTKHETMREAILQVLEGRFGTVPADIAMQLKGSLEEQRLRDLVRYAARSPDLEAFRAILHQ
jgi:predicted transposase YdaD